MQGLRCAWERIRRIPRENKVGLSRGTASLHQNPLCAGDGGQRKVAAVCAVITLHVHDQLCVGP